MDDRYDLPDNYMFFWQAFQHLHQTRGIGFNGYNAITFQEMSAYMQIRHVIEVKEFIEIILMIDKEFLAILEEEQKKQENAEKKKHKRLPRHN
jgi:hypothetical protein